MNAVAGQGIEIGRQGCDQRFTFTGFHFGDIALMQDHAADKLDVLRAQTKRPLCGFANGRESVFQKIIKAFAVRMTRLEAFGAFD